MAIYLIRHGESAGNIGGLMQGRLDLPLTDRGRAQACSVGRWLAALNLQPAAIYASPLQRARETAELIAEQFAGCAARLEPELVEYHVGALEGLVETHLLEQHPSFSTRPLDARGCYAEYGGESYELVQERLGRFIERVAAEHREHDIIAVSHGGSLYQLLKLWCGWPAPRHYFTRIGNCTVFKLNLREVSGHLGAELQFMVPLELIEAGLASTMRLDLPEG